MGALLTIEIAPEAAPTAVGRKLAVSVEFCPAPRLKGVEKPLTVNAVEPEVVTWLILSAVEPVLVIVRFWERFVPTGSFPKLIELALT